MPVIKIKRGASTPGNGTLAKGELATNTTNNQLFVGDASGNPVKLVGSLGAQESNNVSITGGTVAGASVTASSTNLTGLTLTGEQLWYNEGSTAQNYTANWNITETTNMTDFAGLGNVTAHGWSAGPKTYILTLSGIPAHTEIKFECLCHHVDSWDSEAVTINTSNSSGGDVLQASWTKVLSAPDIQSLATYNGTTVSWHNSKSYSYSPWNGTDTDNYNGNYGYAKVTTAWYSHTAGSFVAKIYTGLNQDPSDEAFYISHVRVWIRGVNTTLTAVSTSTTLTDSNSTLPTSNAAKGYADSFKGTLKNIYSYTGNSTYTKSGTDVQKLRVICVGGGGGGRGYHESGGAGGFVERWIDATSISSVAVTVGGGSGGGYYFGFSGQGGTTSFGGYCSATGGYGANQNRSHAGGHGGVGTGGNVNLHGGGGGGHLGGYNNQGSGMSGEGGASFFGGGGQGRHGSHGFSPVAAPGGGGPGGAGNHNGSDGYAGICIVYEYR